MSRQVTVFLDATVREYLANLLLDEYRRTRAGTAEERRAFELSLLIRNCDVDCHTSPEQARDFRAAVAKYFDMATP